MMKVELIRKNMVTFIRLRSKTYSYLIDYNSENKTAKRHKKVCNVRQRFKNKRHNVFTEEINKIASIPSDDKRMQSIDLIETYAYGTSKDLVSDKEEIKCKNIIKRYKKCLSLMKL